MARSTPFPESDYTPFGYLDNPYHSAVLNRSGVIRSVPPLGFGFWVRDLPWPYGNGFGHRRIPAYLSFLHLGVSVDGIVLHEAEDFTAQGINLVSRYHTKLMMSYDFAFQGLRCSARYCLAGENGMVCRFHVRNANPTVRTLTLHATNIYGFPGEAYWGGDGLVGTYQPEQDVGISKVWAYGDIMVLGANRRSTAHQVLDAERAWEDAIRSDDRTSVDEAQTHFRDGGDHLYNRLSYSLSMPAGTSQEVDLVLTRGRNEAQATKEHAQTLASAQETFAGKRAEDARFYQNAPQLVGDWPDHWRHGWIYDLETIRMNIRPPLGIYRHHWDGMQVHTPRVVLGEASLDSWCLSYADMELAKEVMLGTFADAPMPNVPCSREDGSMNMIAANGKECGTAPIWGLPFHVVRSMYLRDRDDAWITQLYPHLKAFLQWWLEHRTDEDGWFHATCSWESGQDGSKRFLVDSHDPGAAAEFVRTVDIEAAMANAMRNMEFFAGIAGEVQDVTYWKELADHRVESTRSMYHDGWYRDVDARNGKPILLKNIEAFGKIQDDYFDIMMLTPVALGIATPDQIEGIKPKFDHFAANPLFWLEWPSFWQPFSEAAWNVGWRLPLGELLATVGERVYERIDRRGPLPVRGFDTGLPEKYNYRIPGVAMEFWPLKEENPGGCENYGWGATFPTLVIRNLIGFREVDRLDADQFLLAPALPSTLFTSGGTYGIRNLNFRGVKLDVHYRVGDGGTLEVSIHTVTSRSRTVEIRDEQDQVVARTTDGENAFRVSFPGVNAAVYTVTLF